MLLIEYFEELHSIKRKIAQDGKDIIVALGVTTEEAEEQFIEVWNHCIKGIYPMEMAVLKETCKDRFDAFIKSLDLLPVKGEN